MKTYTHRESCSENFRNCLKKTFGQDLFSKFQSGFIKMDSIIDFFLCNFPKISRTVIFDIVMGRNPSYETRITYKDFSVQLGVYVKHKQIAC